MRYGPSLVGIKLEDSRVEELLRIADLEPSFASKAVGTLSVGQAQRVALARTLANNPEVRNECVYKCVCVYLSIFIPLSKTMTEIKTFFLHVS